MNKNTVFLVRSATELKLPFRYREEFHGIEVFLAGHRYIFKSGYTPFNDSASVNLTANKYCFNRVLTTAGLPVPKATAVTREDFYDHHWAFLHNLTYPVVAKPTYGSSAGYHVLCGIADEATLIHYLEVHFKEHQAISIEEFHQNLTAYRVLVFFNRVIGVVRRDPAHVVGDGVHTIRELIDLENKNRALRPDLRAGPIVLDQEANFILTALNITADTIPALNERVVLAYNCNAMRGGTTFSLGAEICPENAKLACDVAKALNLNFVGLDVLCEDINIPIEQSRGIFIEGNCNADLTIHANPFAGTPLNTQKIVLKKLISRHPIAYGWHRLRRLIPNVFFNYRLWFCLLLAFAILKYR